MSFFPENLNSNESRLLDICVKEGESESLPSLLKKAEEYNDKIIDLYDEKPLINFDLVQEIMLVFLEIEKKWDAIPDYAKSWIKGAVVYFYMEDDDENDLESPIGFEDDARVLNSCLELAGLDDLVIDIKNFDPEKLPGFTKTVSSKPKSISKKAFPRVKADSEVNLVPGMRVFCRDAEWFITSVKSADSLNFHKAVYCTGCDDLTRGISTVFLTQLDNIEPVDPANTKLITDNSGGYKLSKLYLEAQLRQMPITHTTADLVNMGAFKPMEFQKTAVKKALTQLRPRLLLADAVGLGKTIEVGMIISELMRRGRADRILVLAKKSMLAQFQSELWNRFAIPLVRLDSVGISKLRLKIPTSKNPFEVYNRIIISIDTLKDIGKYRHFLENIRWDVVVIDEAHNVAGASVPERHLSYRLARLLSRKTNSIILTTATPHNGKKETFGRLISLLDPSAIPDLKEYTAEDIKEFFLMRFKEDVKDEAADNFKPRKVVPCENTSLPASEEEESVYKLFAGMREKTKAAGNSQGNMLLQYGLYKLYLSSPEACFNAVKKRLEKINGSADIEYIELKKLNEELQNQAIKTSTRFQVLLEQLKDIGWNGKSKSPRVLIFTEYRKTQTALIKAVAEEFNINYSPKDEDQKQQAIGAIHGSFSDINLMNTVESFGTGNSKMRMLIATDVASEGINLHHECHNIIHYDLPWSIITLIQRNGRIDRFGQKYEPVIRYIMVNTDEGLFKGDRELFERLIKKVEIINESRQSGESVLKLYDPEAEERYIAEKGILSQDETVLDRVGSAGNEEASALEDLLKEASDISDQDDYDFLFDDEAGIQQERPVLTTKTTLSRTRLYADKDYLTEGYSLLGENDRDYKNIEFTGKQILIKPPKDLKRRLGIQIAKNDIIFGATAVPEEAWPEDGILKLSEDPEYVDTAITAARNTSGLWSRVQLCSDQHPILKWLTERLIMKLDRGHAPMIASGAFTKKEICFCFIGQVSSKAGTPLLVDAHAVIFSEGGRNETKPLTDILEEINFRKISNTGEDINSAAADVLLHAAVFRSKEYLKKEAVEKVRVDGKLLQKEEHRLKEWKEKKVTIQRKIISESNSPVQVSKAKKDLDEMDKYLQEREKHWKDAYFSFTPEPNTRLVLVIGGTK